MHAVEVHYTYLEGGVNPRRIHPVEVLSAVPEEQSDDKEYVELNETYGRSDDDVKQVYQFVQQQDDMMSLRICLLAMTRAVYSNLDEGILPIPTDPMFSKIKGHRLAQLFAKNWKMPYPWMSDEEGWVFHIALIYKTLREYESERTPTQWWWWPFRSARVAPDSIPPQPLLDTLLRIDNEYIMDAMWDALEGNVDIHTIFSVSLVSIIYLRQMKKIPHGIKRVVGIKQVDNAVVMEYVTEKWGEITTESELIVVLKRMRLLDVYNSSQMNPREFIHLVQSLANHYRGFPRP